MKKSISLDNSRLEIRNYDVTGAAELLLQNKKEMLYQFVVIWGEQGSIQGYSVRGIDTINLTRFKDAPVMVSTIIKNKEVAHGVEYDAEDKKVILSVIAHMPMFLGAMEELVLASHHEDVISFFYKAIGNKELREFREYCMEESKIDYPIMEAGNSPKVYKKGYRYSIYSLCKDLVVDHAKVMLEGTLGKEKYSRITKSKTVKPEGIQYTDDQWQDIVSISRNQGRANLSIMVKTKVRVDIPENDLGIPQKPIDVEGLKSIALVKDGEHNVRFLTVSVSPKLAHKLRAVGCIEKRLFFKNWLLLDLKRIPVISKKDLQGVTLEEISELSSQVIALRYGIEYLRMKAGKAPKKERKKKLSKQEIFLRELGIVDGKYYPVNEKIVAEGADYEATVSVSNITGLPKEPEKGMNEYINGAEMKSIRIKKNRQNLEKLLTEIDKSGLDIDALTILEKSTYEQLKDMKFKAILGKIDFNEGRGVHATAGKFDLDLNVNWKFVTEKIPV